MLPLAADGGAALVTGKLEEYSTLQRSAMQAGSYSYFLRLLLTLACSLFEKHGETNLYLRKQAVGHCQQKPSI